jgi:carbamoyl-phosphate synthase large subunit
MKITVAVTGLNATDNPGPGIPVIRCLRADSGLEVRVIGLSYETMEPGIFLHEFVDKTYQIPYPSAGKDSLLDRLRYIHSMEKLDLIIPNFDAELFSFIRMSDDLKDMGIATFLPTMKQYEERHKNVLNDFGVKYGISVPASKPIYSAAEIAGLPSEFGFPMVVKGKFYEAYIANNIEQVHTCFHKLHAKWGLPIIIQQFIEGHEFNVAALGDGEGNTIGAIPMRKLVITDKGKGWAGVSIEDPGLIEMTRKLIGETRWKSGLELEIMKSNQGKFYLLEINPRFPAWIYFTAGVGQNLPAALARMALGEKVKPFTSYDVGKMFVRYSMDHICDISEFDRITTLGEL